jgi:uncharacterized protein (UPF0276 family)
MIGVGYHRELAAWVDSSPPGLECLEITAERCFGPGAKHLTELSRRFPLYLHGLGLSLGTPGPLEPRHLEQFAGVCAAANPRWISDHVAFTRTSEGDLGHLNPVRPTWESVRVVAEHAREVAERCGKPMLLENITSPIRLEGGLSEPQFLNEICARAGCGLLLDVTNLFINSRNHRFDPARWLDELDLDRVCQLHIVGYEFANGRWTDSHAKPVQPELIDLASEVVRRAPVESVILERDGDFPSADDLTAEVAKLTRIFAAA